LRDEVAPAYDRMKVNPSSAVPAKQVFDSFRSRHAARLKGKA